MNVSSSKKWHETTQVKGPSSFQILIHSLFRKFRQSIILGWEFTTVALTSLKNCQMQKRWSLHQNNQLCISVGRPTFTTGIMHPCGMELLSTEMYRKDVLEFAYLKPSLEKIFFSNSNENSHCINVLFALFYHYSEQSLELQKPLLSNIHIRLETSPSSFWGGAVRKKWRPNK